MGHLLRPWPSWCLHHLESDLGDGEVSGAPRARQPRPKGRGRELTYWLLTRYTALALFVLALAHYTVTHFVYDSSLQTAEWIKQVRWNSLALRFIDWSFLIIVMVHSSLGMRTVVQDYFKGRTQRIVLGLLYGLTAVLVALGTHVIITLPLK
jgi:succinate dehydrogenase / fumarate reductase membrane anchor subunit